MTVAPYAMKLLIVAMSIWRETIALKNCASGGIPSQGTLSSYILKVFSFFVYSVLYSFIFFYIPSFFNCSSIYYRSYVGIRPTLVYD